MKWKCPTVVKQANINQLRKDDQMNRENTGHYSRTRTITLTALMAAVLCIAGPLALAIPISPVPISLATMAVCFSACILGWKWDAES